MPWTTIEQAREHNKDLTDAEAKTWLKVANSERQRCIDKGGSASTCDAKAIRIANKVVKGVSEKEWMSAEYQSKLGDKLREKIMEKLKTLIARLSEVDTPESKALITEAEAITETHPLKMVEDMVAKVEAFIEAIPASEAVLTDIVPLDEATKTFDVPIKIIQPGWGSSGYYSKALLEGAAKKYHAGTLMFWDHPTESEEHDRPERSLRDLAGVLASDGVFREDGAAGPGIYALCKPFPEFRENIGAMGKYIGISHRALGTAKAGEAEGRKGMVIENIAKVESVDFVTVPGAGGQIVQLFESAKNGGAQENIKQQEELMEKQLQEAQEKLTAKETELAEATKAKEEAEKKLSDSNAKLAEITQKETAEKVSGIVKSALDEVKDLPDAAKRRIKVEPILKEDGSLDEDGVRKSVNDQVVAERNYLAEVAGKGAVKGVGNSEATADDARKILKESFKAKYLREGKPEDQAERMAEIAVNRK